ncbi:hypothetical protein ZWY2020_043274, partial [Hordeum vulgare]
IKVGEDDHATGIVVNDRQCRWALPFNLVGANHLPSGSSRDGRRPRHERRRSGAAEA